MAGPPRRPRPQVRPRTAAHATARWFIGSPPADFEPKLHGPAGRPRRGSGRTAGDVGCRGFARVLSNPKC